MARRVESVMSRLACWVLALNCVGVLQVARCEPPKSKCEAGLFEVLNNKDLKIKDVVQKLDNVEDKSTMIGQVSVAQILKFKSESCDLADLVELDFLSREVSYSCPRGVEMSGGLQKNHGVHLFLDTYRPKRTKACREAIFPELKRDVSNIPAPSAKNIQEFYAAWKRAVSAKGDFPKLNAVLMTDNPPEQQLMLYKHFSTCDKLTEILAKYMPYYELISSHLNHKSFWSKKSKDKTVDEWTGIMKACKAYVDKFCKTIIDDINWARNVCEGQLKVPGKDAYCEQKKICIKYRERESEWRRLIAHPSNN